MSPLIISLGAGDDSESQSEVSLPAQKVNYAPAGSIPSVRNLYLGKPDRNGKSTWTLEYPDDVDEPPENAESAQYALLLRNEKCYNGRQKMQLDSIVLQSKILKDLLGEKVLDGYPGVVMDLDRVTFKPPFAPFVHRWSEFAAAREECGNDAKTRAHIDILWNVLTEELSETLRERDDHLSHGVVRFDNIWTIFEPGMLIYAQHAGEDRIYRLKGGSFAQTSCGGRYYNMQCEYVDFDGDEFGLGVESVKVWEFAGTEKITDLEAFPLAHHPDRDALVTRLEERGRFFESLGGYHFRAYEGVAIGWNFRGFEVKFNVSSRVILDTQAFNRFNPNRSVNLSPLGKSQAGETDSEDDESDYDSSPALARAVKGSCGRKALTKEELILTTSELRGYSLKDKKWLKFNLGFVKDIVWNEAAFASLVAPPEQKELILAFAQSQAAHKHQFDDFIQGKGQGIIMLLSGPPGVGKTLTAESVAETMKVPLYVMSAGDLGTRPHEVESALGNILEMNTKWNAVLLLDEADVFLEARSAHDLERNKLVSIFLRLLEYYEGILFLTTNRVDNIDAAFESRIHLTLEYDSLDYTSRRHVWANFTKRATDGANFSDADIDSLAEQEMNGRQIKNVLKTAQLLAAKQGSPLSYNHVNTVLRLRAQNKSKKTFSLDEAS